MKNTSFFSGIANEWVKSAKICRINLCSSKKGISNDFIFRQHTVSDAKLVDDVALFAGCHAHFLVDVLHVDLQLLDAAIVRISPDGTDDRSIRQHLSGVNGEKRQDIVFCLGQVDLFFINKNLPCIVIDQQVLKAEFPTGGTFILLAVSMAAENSADTS